MFQKHSSAERIPEGALATFNRERVVTENNYGNMFGKAFRFSILMTQSK